MVFDRKPKTENGIIEDRVMKARFWVTLGLLLVVAGCAGYYGPAAPREGYGYEYEPVPPSWYGNDPAMRDWYGPPYFDPHYGN